MAFAPQPHRPSSRTTLFAPYNFVPLSRWVHSPDWADMVSHDIPFADGLCGSLDLRIHAHTPLLVAGGNQSRADERNRQRPEQRPHTFHQLPDGSYAIPGSSLRGMIRNVLEIAAFGRFSLVDNSRFGVRDLTNAAESFYRRHLTEDRGNRTYKPLSRSGWLSFQNGNWYLQPCHHARVEQEQLRAYLGAEWVPISNRERPPAGKKYAAWVQHKRLQLDFDSTPEQPQTHSGGKRLVYRKVTRLGQGGLRGYLVFTGQPGPGKHMEFVFFNPGAPIDPILLDTRTIADFLHIHEESAEWGDWIGRNERAADWRHQFDLGIPVFYLETPGRSGEVYALGLAQMFKLAYAQRVHDLVEHTTPSHLADQRPGLAELIFGIADESDPERSLKGRVDFSAARSVDDPGPKVLTTLAPTILGAPKPTYYPAYVRQDTDRSGDYLSGRDFRTYEGDQAEVRGWKRYPARPVDCKRLLPPLGPDQRDNPKVQVVLCPLDAGAEFTAKMRFHNLRPEELGALIWALRWGGDERYRHALGMGKPFGFGQVSVAIEDEIIIPNRERDDNGVKIEPPTSAQCLSHFQQHMDTAYRDAQTGEGKIAWRASEQIRQLLAMADPNEAPGLAGRLGYMTLERGYNEFKIAKDERRVLPEYAAFDGIRDRDVGWCQEGVQPGVGRSGSTVNPAIAWVEQQVRTIAAQTHAPEQVVWFGRLLADAWRQIDDPALKADALAMIRLHWESAGRWDLPQGKALKQARDVYGQGV